MDTPLSNVGNPTFYTVKEAARILRVDSATIYRAIREDAFPAVRIRSRCLVPAAALDRLIADATESGGVVDPAKLVTERRARESARLFGGGSR